MKAVILCAGMGRRTGLSYPKCLYKIDKKISLLNLNIKKIKKLGFKNSEIILVTGFKEKLIKKETKNLFTYIKNKEYRSTNMIFSLFEVVKKYGIQSYFVFYSDIIFDFKYIKLLSKSKKNIATLIDIDWLKKWKLKKNYLDDLEQLKILNNKIVLLGKKVRKIQGIDGRFVGITKFSKIITKRLVNENFFKRYLNQNKNLDFTNFLMKLIKDKVEVNVIKRKINWFEFDNIDDFKNFKKIKNNNFF